MDIGFFLFYLSGLLIQSRSFLANIVWIDFTQYSISDEYVQSSMFAKFWQIITKNQCHERIQFKKNWHQGLVHLHIIFIDERLLLICNSCHARHIELDLLFTFTVLFALVLCWQIKTFRRPASSFSLYHFTSCIVSIRTIILIVVICKVFRPRPEHTSFRKVF